VQLSNKGFVMSIRRGRVTTAGSDGVAVFLIGMRVNRWYRPGSWLPTLLAMRPMLEELYRDPASGFLGHRTLLGGGGPVLVQYWCSADDVHRYARDLGGRHRPAWAAFYARARRSPGAVGIWHELYEVPAGAHEATYVDMPQAGLGLAMTKAVPV
jgi:hypothetical protein